MRAEIRRVTSKNKLGVILRDATSISYLDDGRDIGTVTFNYPEISSTRRYIQDGQEYALCVDGKELPNGRFILDETTGNELNEDFETDAGVTWGGQTIIAMLAQATMLPRNDIEKQDQVTKSEREAYRKAAREWAKKTNDELEKQLADLIKDARVDNANPGDPPTNVTKERRKIKRDFLRQYDTNKDGKVDWRDFEPSGALERNLDTAPPAKPIVFKNETPGEALQWAIHRAKGRGCFPKLKIDFTEHKDSNGKKWSKRLTTKFDAGGDLLEFVQWMTEHGKAEARMNGWTLQLFNPNTGRDHKQPRVVLARGKNLIDGPRSGTSRELINAVFAKSDNGVHGYIRDNQAWRDQNRITREVTLEFDGVETWDELRDLSLSYISSFNKPRYQYTYGVAPGKGADPYTDYAVMDWIYILTGKSQKLQRMRVYQIALTWDNDNPQGSIALTLNDVLFDRSITNTRQLRRLTGRTGLTTQRKGQATNPERNSDARAPLKPSTPGLTSKNGTIHVVYDGKDYLGDTPNFDQAYVEVHTSSVPNFQIVPIATPEFPDSTLLDTISQAGIISVQDIAYGQTRYVKFVAVDSAGDRSDPSDEVSIAMAQVDTADISFNAVASDQLADEAVQGEHLAGQIILSSVFSSRAIDPVSGLLTGPGQDLSPSGFFSYGPKDLVTGQEVRRVQMPTDPNLPHVFKGDAEIDHLTVQSFATLLASELAEGAVFTMISGITAPTLPPSVSFEWGGVALTVGGTPLVDLDEGMPVGICNIGTTYYTVRTDELTGDGFLVETWNSSGVRTAVNLFVIANQTPHSITTDGTFLYVMLQITNDKGVFSGFTVIKIDATTMAIPVTAAWPHYESNNTRPVAMGYDASSNELLIAQSRNDNSNHPKVHRYTPFTTGTMTRNSALDMDSALGGTAGLSSVHYNTTDFAAARYVLTARSANATTRVYSTTGVRQTADEWPTAGSYAVMGMVFVSGQWKSLDATGILYDYETSAELKWTSPTNDVWKAAHAWRLAGGPYETNRSPIASFTMLKRARLRITTTPPPSGGSVVPDQVRVLLQKGVGSTSPGQMWSQGLLTAVAGISAELVVTAPAFSGTHDLVTSTFPAGGTPSQIQASNNGFYIDSDSGGSVGTGGFRTSVKAAHDIEIPWTPSFDNTTPNYGTGAIRSGNYTRDGDWIEGNFTFVLGTGQNISGLGALNINLPTAVKSGENWDDTAIGTGLVFDSSTSTRYGRTLAIWTLAGGTGGMGTARLYPSGATGPVSGIEPVTLAGSDTIKGSFAYRAAP